MNYRMWTAIAIAAAMCMRATLDADEPAPPTFSGFLVKDLNEAQDAMKAKNYEQEVQKLQEALNAKGQRTAYDNCVINSWLGVAYVKLHNDSEAAPALEAAAEPQCVLGAQRSVYLQVAVNLYSQMHQYQKAISVGQNAIRMGAADADIYIAVATDEDTIGQHRQAAATIQQLIDKEPEPQEKHLELQRDAYIKAGDQADAGKVIDELLRYYPNPDYWLEALEPLLRMNISDKHLQLDIYRLMNEVGVLKMPRDYGKMSELAFDAGYPGEAAAILRKAFAQRVFTDQSDTLRYQQLLAAAQQKAMEDQASLSSQEQKAQKAASGNPLVAVGAAYLSYEEPTKAVAAITAGIQKGMQQSPEEAFLLLGMAQMKVGNEPAALKSFARAQSGTDGYAMLGKLWELLARQRDAQNFTNYLSTY